MPTLPHTDENAASTNFAYHNDAAMGVKTAATQRTALGDVTARANMPSKVSTAAQSFKNRTGLYSRPLNTRHTPEVEVIEDEVAQNHADWGPEDAGGLNDPDKSVAAESDENDSSSSVLADNEPLLLVTTDESRHLVELARQKLHTDQPDPLDEDTYDLVMVVEYTNDIFTYLHELEDKWRPHPRYMLFQPELKWSYRSTLIDWIVQVHARFQLLPETLFLTVNIIDRFLSRKTVTLNRFQLVGAAALFLAAKFEEINCPTIKEILYMLDNAYSKEELLKAERYMINTLEFELGWPGPMSFLRRVSKADDYEYDIRTLAKYLLETTIMDSRLISAQPSWLAAGAYYLSRVILGFNDWTQHHIFYSNYTSEQLFPLATVVLENCRHASQRHQAIFEKYGERRHRRSSYIVARWIAMAEDRAT
ncbi:LAFA_0G23112g1_1 [Lachancea sp. 'fantastica']|nr:LAFA_0G23112g1_1 [Lachancea sp. 'fantastica']